MFSELLNGSVLAVLTEKREDKENKKRNKEEQKPAVLDCMSGSIFNSVFDDVSGVLAGSFCLKGVFRCRTPETGIA